MDDPASRVAVLKSFDGSPKLMSPFDCLNRITVLQEGESVMADGWRSESSQFGKRMKCAQSRDHSTCGCLIIFWIVASGPNVFHGTS